MLQGSTAVDLSSVVETQRVLAPDLCAMLDNARDYRAHLRGLRFYLREFGSDFLPVLPLDATDLQVRRFVEVCRDYQLGAVGLGNFVPLVAPPIHYSKLEACFRRIGQLRRMLPMSHFHLFGVGGLRTGLVSLLFVDSIDTTSWVHDARFWKLRLPGGGVYQTRNTTTSRRRLPTRYWCRCPICRTKERDTVESDGMEGFRARATHNAWVMLREYGFASRARRERRLRAFVRRRIRTGSPHEYLLAGVSKYVRADIR